MSTLERAQIIDEYGDLQRRVKEFKLTQDRYEALGKTIQSWYEESDPEMPYLAEGLRYTITVSAKENQRKIKSIPKLYKFFGREKFLEICSVALGVLDKTLPEWLHAEHIVTARTGKRRLDPIAKVVSIAEASELKRAA